MSLLATSNYYAGVPGPYLYYNIGASPTILGHSPAAETAETVRGLWGNWFQGYKTWSWLLHYGCQRTLIWEKLENSQGFSSFSKLLCGILEQRGVRLNRFYSHCRCCFMHILEFSFSFARNKIFLTSGNVKMVNSL